MGGWRFWREGSLIGNMVLDLEGLQSMWRQMRPGSTGAARDGIIVFANRIRGTKSRSSRRRTYMPSGDSHQERCLLQWHLTGDHANAKRSR